ncbi:MAG: hypothetical protein ACHWZW_12015 [Spirulina sp.]
MTALYGHTTTPQERLLSEILQRAARLPLKDLTFLCETANALYEKRIEAEMRVAEFATQQPPEPDPHGV